MAQVSHGRVVEPPAGPPPMESMQAFETGTLYGTQPNFSSSTVIAEKRARKAAEEDAMRLYNRVRQLQKEEEKASRRIEETRRKAQEIYSLRERNELKALEKDERQREVEEETAKIRQMNYAAKEESQKKRAKSERKLVKEKLSIAEQTKEEHAVIAQLLAEARLVGRIEALEKKEAVRREEARAAQRTHRLRAEKLRMVQEDYEQRLKEEVQARVEKERELERLAKQEMQLIQRLKRRQVEQQQALMQLEAALNLGRRASPLRQSSARGEPAAPPLPPPAPPTGPPPPPGEPSEEEVAAAFALYDPEDVGSIPTGVIGDLMARLGMPLNEFQLQQAAEQLDRQHTGQVPFGEFLLWWKG